jgi:hypothetical protein
MLKANEAKIEWSAEKKQWHVVIQVGAEVIKRWAGKTQETGDEALKSLAVRTAKDEGYELDPERVSVVK